MSPASVCRAGCRSGLLLESGTMTKATQCSSGDTGVTSNLIHPPCSLPRVSVRVRVRVRFRMRVRMWLRFRVRVILGES